MSEQSREEATERSRQIAWDLRELLERVDGDETFLHELLVMFREDTRLNLEKSRKAIADRDFQTLSRAAHTLKGMLRNLSMNAAGETAAALETASRENRQGESTDLLEKLRNELEEILPEVEAQLAGVRS